MIKCVIFDCDGTLVDSELLCHTALQEEFAEYGIIYPASAMLAKFRGWKLDEIMANVAEVAGSNLADDFETRYRDRLAKSMTTDLSPCEGIEQALNEINLPKCVASSGPVSKIQRSLTLTHLRHYFGDNLFSCYDLGKWKPEPDVFLHASRQMGFKPTECLVVEDSEVGIQAANNAGMASVHYHPHEKCKHEDAEHGITHHDELAKLIQETFSHF